MSGLGLSIYGLGLSLYGLGLSIYGLGLSIYGLGLAACSLVYIIADGGIVVDVGKVRKFACYVLE